MQVCRLHPKTDTVSASVYRSVLICWSSYISTTVGFESPSYFRRIVPQGGPADNRQMSSKAGNLAKHLTCVMDLRL